MIASACHNGRGCYGLRILGGRVGLWFRPEWRWVTLHLPGEDKPVSIAITDSFWESKPELRSPRIRAFLERNGFLPWTRSRPPHFELVSRGGGVFELKWLEKHKLQPKLRLD